MTQPSIQTTIVGSYPLPAWLVAMSTRTTMRDALLVVLKTQELAGIDVIAVESVHQDATPKGAL